MADVRCPMCGKPNPADAEVCRHSWQRLKPAKSDASSAQPPASNEPEWLRELRSDRGATPLRKRKKLRPPPEIRKYPIGCRESRAQRTGKRPPG